MRCPVPHRPGANQRAKERSVSLTVGRSVGKRLPYQGLRPTRENMKASTTKNSGQALHEPPRPPEPEKARASAFGEKLNVVIGNLPPDQITLAEIRDLVGHEGLLLLAAFLTLVFMIPVSIPGVSTVFGAGILLIGLCRLFRIPLWLPKFIAFRRLPADKLRAGLVQGSKWLHRLERVSRPHRMHRLAGTGLADTLNSAALVFGAGLLMAPFGLIPFSNTLPALALLFLSIGLLQRDGLCILLGHILNVVTLIYFFILIADGGVAIHEIIQYFRG